MVLAIKSDSSHSLLRPFFFEKERTKVPVYGTESPVPIYRDEASFRLYRNGQRTAHDRQAIVHAISTALEKQKKKSKSQSSGWQGPTHTACDSEDSCTFVLLDGRML